jgi:hypothetical protein
MTAPASQPGNQFSQAMYNNSVKGMAAAQWPIPANIIFRLPAARNDEWLTCFVLKSTDCVEYTGQYYRLIKKSFQHSIFWHHTWLLGFITSFKIMKS